MTTNVSECINGVLKGTRRLPVAATMRATYERLQQLFIRKGWEAMAQLNAGQQWSQHLIQAEVFTVDELEETESTDVNTAHNWLPMGLATPMPTAAPTATPFRLFSTTYVHTDTLKEHEIAGVVTEVGSKVQNFKVGDKVGVGVLVASCKSCESCAGDLENFCPQMVLTYSAKNKDGTITYGGYSDSMVVDEAFAIRIPDNLPLDVAAPLLCAGITVYSPLRYFGLDKPGLHVGVVGLGGLGHVAVKFAKAFGCKVTVISTSPNKKKEAIESLGADSFLVSRDQDQMKGAVYTLDGIIDTVSAVHPLAPLLALLKANGKLVMVGLPEKPLELPIFSLTTGRKSIAGSCIGGIKETQEMIDFAAKHNVKPDIEVIAMDYVNTAMERLVKADVKYRFVIDVGNTLKSTS
ncbi:8-hydroxygeraniol dehydrogenase [Stylosanthes scabra]|uniref:8-hydroxygeraniol dehydrogenase n=1 Tax=Stylosanthes scabra TaxID=79078 RepID=A0ABU6WMH8_9FABA|nr:8-hydroxygeraniol dehydrogenase [Stylosanthes scabra]